MHPRVAIQMDFKGMERCYNYQVQYRQLCGIYAYHIE